MALVKPPLHAPGLPRSGHRQPAENAPVVRRPDAGELRWQLLLPLAIFLLANIVLMAFAGDQWIADHLFALEGGHWALKDNFFTTTVIHETGKRLSTLAWLVAAIATVHAWRKPALLAWRQPLLGLVVSVLVATLAVTLMKHLTHMDCPWDLQAYGGSRPPYGLFTPRPAGLRASGCFPAGHASAGYAWVALYFFFLAVRPRWRWAGLSGGIIAGLVFGISQQLRGAHFMSHDLWTLMICWTSALVVYRCMRDGAWRGRNAPAPQAMHRPWQELR